MIGRARPERVFSVAHTGGDLSAPDAVRAVIQPNAIPGAGLVRYSVMLSLHAGGRSGAVGARPDGIDPRLSHHPGPTRRVVGVHDPRRELARHQEGRRRRVVARATLVQVHGGDVRRRRGHRHGAHVRVRAALAELHGQVRRRVRYPVHDRGPVLLRRSDLHRDLHLRLEAPEAVGAFLDRRADRDRRHRRRGVGGRRELVDERAGGFRSQLGRQGRQRRADRGDLQQRDALRNRPHARRRVPRRRVPHRLGLRRRVPAWEAATGITASVSSSRSPSPPSPPQSRWSSATRWLAGSTTTSRPSSPRSSWSPRRQRRARDAPRAPELKGQVVGGFTIPGLASWLSDPGDGNVHGGARDSTRCPPASDRPTPRSTPCTWRGTSWSAWRRCCSCSPRGTRCRGCSGATTRS